MYAFVYILSFSGVWLLQDKTYRRECPVFLCSDVNLTVPKFFSTLFHRRTVSFHISALTYTLESAPLFNLLRT